MNAAGSPEQKIMGSTVELLDSSRGVVEIPLGDAGIDPDRRSNLSVMALAMGEALAPMPGVDPLTDKSLKVFRRDFERGSVVSIESGLYIPPDDIRRPKADLLVVIGHQPNVLDGLKGVAPNKTGVVFPAEEFKIVARNARDFAKHVRAGSINKNADNPNREEAEATADRAAGHAMDIKISGMNSLENQLIEEFELLSQIFRQAKSNWRAQYKAKNLDRDRKKVDEIIHNIAETSVVNFNFGTTAVNGIHRAIASNLYRRGSSSEISRQWRLYTAMAGRYANARRGKIAQSRKDCEEQLQRFQPALDEKAALEAA